MNSGINLHKHLLEWTLITLNRLNTCILIIIARTVKSLFQGPFFNSLAPGRPGCHFKTAIFNLVILIVIFTSSKDNALRWMPRDLTDDKSRLVQVMAWCRQATSHYLSQCWPRSLSPYGVTRPQWVKTQHGLVVWKKVQQNFNQNTDIFVIKMHLKMTTKYFLFCPSFNVLM